MSGTVVAANGVCDESGIALVNVINSCCVYITVDSFFVVRYVIDRAVVVHRT